MIGAPVLVRSPFAKVPVTVVAGGLFAVLMAFSARYGYHRDELYFRMLGEQGKPILLCRGPVRTWSALWPDLRHYS